MNRGIALATVAKILGALLLIFGVIMMLNEALYVMTGHRLFW